MNIYEKVTFVFYQITVTQKWLFLFAKNNSVDKSVRNDLEMFLEDDT